MMNEKRGAQRRTLRHTSWILAGPNQSYPCTLSDISDSGGRIDVEDADKVPDRFFLLLSERGTVRRTCRVIWRKPDKLGVKFERPAPAPKKRRTLSAPQPAAAPTAEAKSEAKAEASAAAEPKVSAASKSSGELVHVD
jgi:hypothetical protein